MCGRGRSYKLCQQPPHTTASTITCQHYLKICRILRTCTSLTFQGRFVLPFASFTFWETSIPWTTLQGEGLSIFEGLGNSGLKDLEISCLVQKQWDLRHSECVSALFSAGLVLPPFRRTCVASGKACSFEFEPNGARHGKPVSELTLLGWMASPRTQADLSQAFASFTQPDAPSTSSDSSNSSSVAKRSFSYLFMFFAEIDHGVKEDAVEVMGYCNWLSYQGQAHLWELCNYCSGKPAASDPQILINLDQSCWKLEHLESRHTKT